MRTRHKIPNVFSLSMMDVLCCALGCVILLWLLGAKQAEDDLGEARDVAANASERAALLLEDTKTANVSLERRVASLLVDRDKAVRLEASLARRIAELERLRDQLDRDLGGSKLQRAELEAKLKNSSARVTELESDVKARLAALDAERDRTKATDKMRADAQARYEAANKALDDERARAAAKQKELTALKGDVEARTREMGELKRSLTDAEAARKTLEGTLTAQLTSAKKDAKDRGDTLAARVAELEKENKKGADALAAAEKANRGLEQQLASFRMPKDKDGRFAGIALTGRRVVFLVDMSGSMKMVRWQVDAPGKWAEVCETVGRLMRSLAGLQQYQVICFSTELLHPLGGRGEWQDFDPVNTPDRAVKALKAVQPKGGTNMFVAVKEAFEYAKRDRGLDAVYLLSDGLPNDGEGLTEMQEKTWAADDVRRGQTLGRHVLAQLRDDWNKGRKVRINTIGFFYESPDLGSFLWALARENDGSFVGMSKP